MKILGVDLVFLPKKEAGKLVIILAVGIPLAFFVWRANVRREHSRMENLALFHSLSADTITRVTVSDPHGVIIKSITDAAALAAFADAVHSTTSYEPNHPSYTRSFVATVAFKGGAPRQYEWHTIFPADQTIYLDFPYGGNGKNKPLYTWMKSQSLL